MEHCQTRIPKFIMSLVLQNLYFNVDYFEILTIFDTLDLNVSGKFCIEDLTRLLMRAMNYAGVEKGRNESPRR